MALPHALAVWLALGASGANAQQLEQAKVIAADPGAGDQFASSVAVSASYLLAGAPWDNSAGVSNHGAAYIFRRNPAGGWAQQAKLLATGWERDDWFGSSVGLAGEWAVVGAMFDKIGPGWGGFQDGEGTAYMFRREGTTWSEHTRLVHSNPSVGDYFGTTVAIAGETVVVGADHDNVNGLVDGGSAHVFVWEGTAWQPQAFLTPSDGAGSDRFGWSTAVAGDTVIVGAIHDDHATGTNGGQSGEGAAYVFVRNGTTWSEQAKLTAGDAAPADVFGFSVAVSGDTALVGAYWDNHDLGVQGSPSGQGAAYVFVRVGSTWTQQAKLTAGDAAAGDEFGHSVALCGSAAVVGSRSADSGGAKDVGAAYVFTRTGSTWSEAAKLLASDGTDDDRLGAHVAVSAGRAVVGAPEDDHSSTPNAGSAYVYDLPVPTAATYCTAGVSASGCAASMTAAGVPSSTEPSGFLVEVVGVEGDKDGILFFSSHGRQAVSWGNGTSYQCVVPPVKRGGLLQGSGTPLACDGSFSQDLNALWCASCPKPAHNPGVGAVVQAQLWYRDPLSTGNRTTSLSDALEFCVAP